jgi:tyrosyl-DNA phosphodiesterase-1
MSKENDDNEEARFQADLARAIAASKQDLSPATSIASLPSDCSQIEDLKSTPPSTVTAQSNSSFLRERAQLEQERLARLKRLRDEPHPQDTEPSLKRLTPSREVSSAPVSEAGPSQRGTVDEGVEVFWDGELRQTANAHVELGRNGEYGRPIFRLSQIIGDVSRFFLPPMFGTLNERQKSEIELAIISTYALQLSWIYTFFHPRTPVVLVTQPAPSENGNPTIKEVLPNWIRVTPFLRGGRGVMHMKVRASDLFFSTFIGWF